MPQYSFTSLDGSTTTQLYYPMKTAPRAGDIVEVNGIQWRRVFTAPQMATKGLKPVDPFSQKQFREKTGAMKGGTVGDLWDYSKELSQRREEKTGTADPVRQKYYSKWSEKKGGMRHPAELAEHQQKTLKATNEKLKEKGIKITLGD